MINMTLVALLAACDKSLYAEGYFYAMYTRKPLKWPFGVNIENVFFAQMPNIIWNNFLDTSNIYHTIPTKT